MGLGFDDETEGGKRRSPAALEWASRASSQTGPAAMLRAVWRSFIMMVTMAVLLPCGKGMCHCDDRMSTGTRCAPNAPLNSPKRPAMGWRNRTVSRERRTDDSAMTGGAGDQQR